MSISEGYLAYVLDQLSGFADVSARKMFGGAGLYHDERMFGLIAEDTAYLKVDDSNRAQYEAAGAAPFKPFADKPMTMSYYEIPPDVLDNRDLLVQWARQSAAVAAKKQPARRGRNRRA